jgi:hypothetical protein
VHTVASLDELDEMIALTRTNRAGIVQFHDVGMPFPYGVLPADPFWSHQVFEIARGVAGIPPDVQNLLSDLADRVAALEGSTPATVPGAPTSVVATGGNGQASVAFTPPSSNGGAAITSYTVTASPGGAQATGTSSPIVVPGLTNGVSYTFTVRATNSVGQGTASAASNSVTPAAVTGGSFAGSNGSPWPAPWTGAVGQTVDIQDGFGRLVTASDIYSQSHIRRPAPANAELLFRWRSTAGISSVDIAIRGGNNYGDNPKWTYRHLSDGIWLNGASGLLNGASAVHSVGVWYWSRIRWEGNTVKGRTWTDGAVEPSTWSVQGTDGGSPTSGNLIFRVENGDSVADSVLFDNVTVTDLGGGGTVSGAYPDSYLPNY